MLRSAIQLTCQACRGGFVLMPDNMAELTEIRCPWCKAVYMDLEALRGRIATARKRIYSAAEQVSEEFQAHWELLAKTYWRDLP